MTELAKSSLMDDLYGTAKRAYQNVARSYRMLGGTRILLASHRALPAFIIVGAQKGGTSSLYLYLSSHPRILPASRKEVHFFDLYHSRGVKWYRSHFPTTRTLERSGAITGEASPYYLYHPHAAQRIAEVVPDAKLIVCLRNPVDRAISHYWHTFRRGSETLPMEEAFRMERERVHSEKRKLSEDDAYYSESHQHHSYLERGIYVDQLSRYTELFDRANILVLRSEDLFRDTQNTYDRVLSFLGVPPQRLADQRARNLGEYRGETKPEVKEELAKFFEPHNKRLYEFLGLKSAWW
jgi:hypothetical protein